MTMLKEFDITAPIERQFSRDGQKVLAICDSGLDCKFPISAWIGENTSLIGLTKKNGHYWSDTEESDTDLITRPELLPLIVGFHDVNLRRISVGSENPTNSYTRNHDVFASLKITYDPNTGESSAETVWQKEAK